MGPGAQSRRTAGWRRLAAATVLLLSGGLASAQDNASNGIELANRMAALIGATDACGDDDSTAALIQRYQQLLDGLGRQGLMDEGSVRELERTGRQTARKVREDYETSASNCAQASAAAEALLGADRGPAPGSRRTPEI